jgi:hypothetical protein
VDEILITLAGSFGVSKKVVDELALVEPKLHAVVPGLYLAEHDVAGRRAQTTVTPLLRRLGVPHLVGNCTAGVTNYPAWGRLIPRGDTQAGFHTAHDRYVLFAKSGASDILSILLTQDIVAKRLLDNVLIASPVSDAKAPRFPDRLSRTLSEKGLTYGFVKLGSYSAPYSI